MEYPAQRSPPLTSNSLKTADDFVQRVLAYKALHRQCRAGTELSKLLKRFGIEPTPTCQCRAKAAEMDAWGCDECSRPERIDEVVAVMREEAKARGLPFLDAAGRVLVRRAIRNARAEARRAEEAKQQAAGESRPAV